MALSKVEPPEFSVLASNWIRDWLIDEVSVGFVLVEVTSDVTDDVTAWATIAAMFCDPTEALRRSELVTEVSSPRSAAKSATEVPVALPVVCVSVEVPDVSWDPKAAWRSASNKVCASPGTEDEDAVPKVTSVLGTVTEPAVPTDTWELRATIGTVLAVKTFDTV